ncbi:hypothetical protein FACS189441_0330 [Betaproteobacteria bacterium]|nr:hypothetical protein FACS189441_0330 [Betaproteobacteria bacterium]
MPTLPKYTDKNVQERLGVNNVALNITKLGLIWRETSNTDVGIDGQIEYVNNAGEATGKIVAVQIKSGNSYLHNNATDVKNWTFYPEEKHKYYWEQYPIPVILLIYRPDDNNVYFIDARYYLKVHGISNIKIPKDNILNETTKKKLFETIGDFDEPFLEINDVFSAMISIYHKSPSFNVSYLDLFLLGLTNLCRQIYFDISVAIDIAESRSPFVTGGGEEYEFVYNYVRFIVSQNLAEIDFGDYLIDWNENKLVPRFISPITRRGRELLEHINSIEENHPSIMPETHLVQERLIHLDFDEYTYRRIEKLQHIVTVEREHYSEKKHKP